MEKIFDLDGAMERLLNDTDFLKEMIEIFITEATNIVSSIEQGTCERNSDLVQRSVHALKGCAANIGADAILSLAERIEEALRINDLNSVEQISSKLRAGLEDFKLESARVLH